MQFWDHLLSNGKIFEANGLKTAQSSFRVPITSVHPEFVSARFCPDAAQPWQPLWELLTWGLPVKMTSEPQKKACSRHVPYIELSTRSRDIDTNWCKIEPSITQVKDCLSKLANHYTTAAPCCTLAGAADGPVADALAALGATCGALDGTAALALGAGASEKAPTKIPWELV